MRAVELPYGDMGRAQAPILHIAEPGMDEGRLSHPDG